MSDTSELSQQALDHFIELLEKKEFKKTLIKSINEDIDIPFINENRCVIWIDSSFFKKH